MNSFEKYMLINTTLRIADILACSFLDDLLELRDQDLAKDIQEANWFSAQSALRVYGKSVKSFQ